MKQTMGDSMATNLPLLLGKQIPKLQIGMVRPMTLTRAATCAPQVHDWKKWKHGWWRRSAKWRKLCERSWEKENAESAEREVHASGQEKVIVIKHR